MGNFLKRYFKPVLDNKFMLIGSIILMLFMILMFIIIFYYIFKHKTIEKFESVEYVEDSTESPDSEYNYTELTEKKPDLIPKNDEIVIGLFYANWCPHCVHFKPTFKKVGDMWRKNNKKTINNKKLRFVEIDCEVLSDLAKKYNVKGYPTIKIIDQNNDIEYTGSRDEHDFAKYLETL